MHAAGRPLVAAAVAATLALASSAAAQGTPAPEPPFNGTIFVDRDIIRSSDASTFSRLRYVGFRPRTVFDRRRERFVKRRAYVFRASFADGLRAEVVVNSEFRSRRAATSQARTYARETGRLPRVLRTGVRAIWIHRGKQPFGGGNRSLLIHTGQAGAYRRDGILEETLVHEAVHTSLDGRHARALGWRAAQAADGRFISTYARDETDDEDLAETFLLWLALRHRRDRIDASLAELVERTVPNRLAYLDRQGFPMRPLTPSGGG